MLGDDEDVAGLTEIKYAKLTCHHGLEFLALHLELVNGELLHVHAELGGNRVQIRHLAVRGRGFALRLPAARRRHT